MAIQPVIRTDYRNQWPRQIPDKCRAPSCIGTVVCIRSGDGFEVFKCGRCGMPYEVRRAEPRTAEDGDGGNIRLNRSVAAAG
jgi:hypothetical protein